MPSGRIVARWQGHGEVPKHLALSPDGERVVTADGSAVIQWSTAAAYQDDAGKPLDPALRTTVTNSIGIRLVPMPAGKFSMGTASDFQLVSGYRSERGDEQPVHEVTLTRPFYLGAHEVTVAQFRAFVDATGYKTTAETKHNAQHITASNTRDPWQIDPKLDWRNPGFKQSEDHPVVQVTRVDAVKFCEWLSQKENVRYRLPTEAEWEYGCRAGTDEHYSIMEQAITSGRGANVADAQLRSRMGQWGTAIGASDRHAYSSPVGSYPPNGFGLFDVHGNVFEWAADLYSPVYFRTETNAVDPTGPKTGTESTLRSGAFFYHWQDVRSGARESDKPDQPTSCSGFRVARDFTPAAQANDSKPPGKSSKGGADR